MNAPSSVLVVGASAGGLAVAEALRRQGFPGRLTLLGAEKRWPYDRPPLSKKVLAGDWAPGQTQLRTEDALGKLDAEFVLGEAAIRLDVGERAVETSAGRVLRAESIVIATGLEPRRLSGQDSFSGVFVLRTLDDALALREKMLTGPRVCVVGDGVLGTEIAATARGMGLDVTLCGPQSALLGSQLGPFVGGVLGELHEARGVKLRLGALVDSLEGEGGRVSGVRLAGGEVIPAELVVVAIGSRPAVGWLEGSGLRLSDGIVCDSRCRAAEGVHAVGDVAFFHHEGLGRGLRLENRTNAVEQGIAVAGNILGADKPYTPVPYFWTDQYDAKIQVYGVLSPGDEVAVVEGDPARLQFIAVFGRGGKVVGAVGWNMVRQMRVVRQHVVDGTDFGALAPRSAADLA